MDHVVYLDVKAQEMEKILSGAKTMVIRGAAGRKLPYGRVEVGDVLYFINNNAEGSVKAKGVVDKAYNSEKLTPNQSSELISQHQSQLQLTDLQIKRWSSKRYIVLIGIRNVQTITPFKIDKKNYGNMDDWLLVEKIDNIKQ
ncbi:MAG TPA: hypothetical protein PLZ62_00990 [bacterium]|nr:hypothetical protein [bacterium]